MHISDDDDYEELGAEYQYQIIALLDRAMKAAGAPEDMRRAVAGDFIFAMSMLHDQGSVTADGVTCQPVLAFRESDSLRLPNDEFELHDYAFGNVDAYFDPES